MSISLLIQGVISYPHVFAARAYQAGDEPRFSCSIIPTDPNFDWNAVQTAINEASLATHGSNPPAGLASPLSQVKDGPYAGMWQITATAKEAQPPEIVDGNIKPLANNGQLFAGCVCNFDIKAFAYPKGVSTGLNKIQLVDNGPHLPRLDGGKSAEEVFSVVPMTVASPLGGPTGQPAQVQQQPQQAQPQQAQPMQQQPQQAQPMQQPMQQPVQQQPMQQPVQQQPQQAQPMQPPMQQQPQQAQPMQQPMQQPVQQPVQQQPMQQPVQQQPMQQGQVQTGAPAQMPWNG